MILIIFPACDHLVMQETQTGNQEVVFSPYPSDLSKKGSKNDFSCNLSYHTPNNPNTTYQYRKIKVTFADKLLENITGDMSVTRYKLESKDDKVLRYAVCLLPKETKLIQLVIQKLQANPEQNAPDIIIDSDINSKKQIKIQPNTITTNKATLKRSSVMPGTILCEVVGWFDWFNGLVVDVVCTETEPFLQSLITDGSSYSWNWVPTWDWNNDNSGGGSSYDPCANGGCSLPEPELDDVFSGPPPDCTLKPPRLGPLQWLWCLGTQLKPTQKTNIETELAKIKAKGGICSELADLGYLHINNFRTFSMSNLQQVFGVDYVFEKKAYFGLAGGTGSDYIGLLDELVNDPDLWYDTPTKVPNRVNLSWILVHELDHLYGEPHREGKHSLSTTHTETCSSK